MLRFRFQNMDPKASLGGHGKYIHLKKEKKTQSLLQLGKVLLLFCYSAVSRRATLTNLQQVGTVPPLCTELTEAAEQNCDRLHLYSKMVALGLTLERLASPNYTNLFISCKAGCLKKKQTKELTHNSVYGTLQHTGTHNLDG